MSHGASAYGLWFLVVVNSAVFILFAFSFTRPRTRRDWRSLGAFSAFVVALFAEMYGFPLTIYLLSGWLGSRFPVADPLSHESGHLWIRLLGFRGDPHLNVVHLLSGALIVGGFYLVGSAWRVLHAAQREGALATTGPYAVVRHPQYGGFILVLAGFFLQWPTLPTAAMFPVLVVMYVRLARREEREVRQRFALEYEIYARETPAFIPKAGPGFTRHRRRQDRPGRATGGSPGG
jgi:protein-S-isoprenylcysteine O-methyltransferase Ste14